MSKYKRNRTRGRRTLSRSKKWRMNTSRYKASGRRRMRRLDKGRREFICAVQLIGIDKGQHEGKSISS